MYGTRTSVPPHHRRTQVPGHRGHRPADEGEATSLAGALHVSNRGVLGWIHDVLRVGRDGLCGHYLSVCPFPHPNPLQACEP
jgi:hypothetical protein